MPSDEIVPYRKTESRVMALEGALPNCKLPLPMDRIKGSTVECGYAVLIFDGVDTRISGHRKGFANGLHARLSGRKALWKAKTNDQSIKDLCKGGIKRCERS